MTRLPNFDDLYVKLWATRDGKRSGLALTSVILDMTACQMGGDRRHALSRGLLKHQDK